MLSAHCAILLKGGHHPEKIGIDTLYTKRDHPVLPKNHRSQKNMVQAVLSSAIVSNLFLETI
jgi:hydroxymethylpyrimidine/phosphomethylpyrimidine kinase